MRFAYAADRDIGVWALEHALAQGDRPVALLVPALDRASHAEELIRLCDHLDEDRIFVGASFRSEEGIARLRELDLDLLVSVHFPYVVPQAVLDLPRHGAVNLHPAYLPYNRGWHTPTWAILEQTPVGATLHRMDPGVDTGDIIHRRQLEVSPGDTANTLYQRLKALELEVFREAWTELRQGQVNASPQDPSEGTSHRRQDLSKSGVQRLDLNERMAVGDLLRRLRGLTTNRWDEAAWFEADGRRYRVQVTIQAEEPDAD